MSSLSNKNVAQSKLIPRIGVVDTVFAINELIFMILDALHEPVDPPSRRLLHNTRKYPTSRWLSQNERNYRNCILVNRRWCNCAQRYLWRDLAFPRVAFNAVLQQFETTTSTTVEGIVGNRKRQQPREAYVRYCFYAAMVESMMLYRVTKDEDLEICAQLEHFGLNGSVFPRLKKITLATRPDEIWFPGFTHKHAVSDICIEVVNSTGSVKVIQAISEYCPKVERLVVNGLLDNNDIDFLAANEFKHLTSLSIDARYWRMDNFMRVTVSITHNLTNLALPSAEFLFKITKGGGSFRSLLILRLYRFLPGTIYIADLPDAPQLRFLLIDVLAMDRYLAAASSQAFSQAFQAIEEFSKRSPFSKLQIGNPFAFQDDLASFNFSGIGVIHSLTELSITVPRGVINTLPQRLQTLTLVLGKGQKPELSLYDLFSLAVHAPHLKSVTAQMDLRIGSNTDFLLQPEESVHGTEYSIREQLYSYSFRSDITQYQTSSLRVLDFKSSPLRKRDQLFLFSVLQELAPNLELSTKMLRSIHWRPRKVANIAMLYLGTSTNESPATITGLVEHLSCQRQ